MTLVEVIKPLVRCEMIVLAVTEETVNEFFSEGTYLEDVVALSCIHRYDGFGIANTATGWLQCLGLPCCPSMRRRCLGHCLCHRCLHRCRCHCCLRRCLCHRALPLFMVTVNMIISYRTRGLTTLNSFSPVWQRSGTGQRYRSTPAGPSGFCKQTAPPD